MSDNNVERKKITDFEQDNANANQGTERGLRMLDDSLNSVGLGRSIVVDKHGRIIAGNKTTERAVDSGFEDAIVVKTDGKQLVVVQRDDLDLYDNDPDNPARKLAYYDNRVGQLDLQWDSEQLFKDKQSGFDLAPLFSEQEQAELFADMDTGEAQDAPEAQIDRAEELNEIWQVQPGDLWQIGTHRLLCGDSTNADDVAWLMDGKKAEMCFTSPPYADQRDYGEHSDLSIETLVQFIPAANDYVNYFCVNLGIKRSNYEIVQYWDDYIQAARDCGLKLLSWNVWDKKQAGSIGAQDAIFPIEHEWIFVFGTEPKPPNRFVEKAPHSKSREKYYDVDAQGRYIKKRRQPDGTMSYSTHGNSYEFKALGSVIEAQPELSNIRELHSAIMGIDVVLGYILAITNDADVIYEPFCGSGTTLAACEQLNRIGYGIEIEPKYCAVILQRMADMGLEPDRID